jgi:hypothetical protein
MGGFADGVVASDPECVVGPAEPGRLLAGVLLDSGCPSPSTRDCRRCAGRAPGVRLRAGGDLLAQVAVRGQVVDESRSPFVPKAFADRLDLLAHGGCALLSCSQQVSQQGGRRSDYDSGQGADDGEGVWFNSYAPGLGWWS